MHTQNQNQMVRYNTSTMSVTKEGRNSSINST